MASVRWRTHLPGAASCSALTLLAALVTACGEGPTGPGRITELPRALTTSEQAVVQASNSFAVHLLRQAYKETPSSTVFLSPFSASMALGMTMNGATGETLDQMRQTLGFGSMPMANVNASYRSLLDLLENLDPTVQLAVANAIFHRNTFQMEQPFLETMQRYFDAEIRGLDFSDPSAGVTINDWVKAKTNDRIDRIVEVPIDPSTTAILLNAVYFKGDWTKSFDPGDTYTGPFHLLDGSTQDVRFMVKKDTLGYRETDAWNAVELPYGSGAFEMIVAVPTTGHTLDDVAVDLGSLLGTGGSNDATWPREVVEIHLPRFQLAWERTLNDDLRALGMLDAFDPYSADFTPMYRYARDTGLHIEKVKQKTFLKVDEIGTEAAAVTAVEMGIISVHASPPIVKADRPFFLAIRERLTGTVLFEGFIVQAPEE